MSLNFRDLALVAILALLGYGCAATGGEPVPHAVPEQRRPVFNAQVSFAGGDYEHDIDGSIKDDTSASWVGVLVEGGSRRGFGGGVSLEVMSSQDDLFEGQATSSAQVSIVEVAPFFLYRMSAGERFRMPIRVGPWIHVLTLEDQGNSDSLDWVSFGLRAAAEPELVLIQRGNFEWSLFTGLSLAGGATQIELNSSAGDETFDSSAAAFGFELGPRFRFSHFHAAISFLHRGYSAAESDPENNAIVRGIDTRFNGLAFSFGGGF